jgi:hypothetical protein
MLVPVTEPDRVGQIVFLPGIDSRAVAADFSAGGLRIDECAITPEGLRVQGSVPVAPGVTVVEVGPGDPTAAGLGVSAVYAASAGKLQGAAPGYFVVVLPWASPESGFVMLKDQAPEGPVPVAAARCP